MALVGTVLLGLLTDTQNTSELSTESITASAFLVQAWVPQYVSQLNYPGWSLCAESLFYLLFPIVYKTGLQLPTKSLVLVTSLLWLVSLSIHFNMLNTFRANEISEHLWFNISFYNPLLHLNTFVAGVTTGIVFVRHQPWFRENRQGISLTLVTLALIMLGGVISHSPVLRYHHNGLLAPLFASFIVWQAIQDNKVSRLLCKPLPLRLGEISYGIYMLQVPVSMAVFYVNNHYFHLGVGLAVPVFVGILCCVSSVSYSWIEQPARRMIRQWTHPSLLPVPVTSHG